MFFFVMLSQLASAKAYLSSRLLAVAVKRRTMYDEQSLLLHSRLLEKNENIHCGRDADLNQKITYSSTLFCFLLSIFSRCHQDEGHVDRSDRQDQASAAWHSHWSKGQ